MVVCRWERGTRKGAAAAIYGADGVGSKAKIPDKSGLRTAASARPNPSWARREVGDAVDRAGPPVGERRCGSRTSARERKGKTGVWVAVAGPRTLEKALVWFW